MTMAETRAGRIHHLGIFTVAMATMMLQILITRLVSVTLYYHYAFAIISLTMLGMTTGAVVVYVFTDWFPERDVEASLAAHTRRFAACCMVAPLLHVSIPFLSQGTVWSLVANFLIFLPQFIFSGIIITLLLTRYPKQISTLYAADLSGAAIGCLLTLWVLEWVGGINGILFVASVLFSLAIPFARAARSQAPERSRWELAVLSAGLLVANVVLGASNLPHVTIFHPKDGMRSPDHEVWNSYSRVTFSHAYQAQPFGWGLSQERIDSYAPIEQRLVTIDSGAATVLTRFDGDLEKLDFLRDDLVNIAYWVRPVHDVAVIGVGAGRDLLTALLFGADRVLGIEMNGGLVQALSDRYEDFSGALHRDPRIELVHDEARSYLSRHAGSFDLIQMSLIDTFAATAAGAFSLSENTLYTIEAWESFFALLSPNGMMSFSRWYQPHGGQGELLRMLSLTHHVLKKVGVGDPVAHVAVVHSNSIATLMVSRSAFGSRDITALREAAGALGFEVMLPSGAADGPWQRILTTGEFPDSIASGLIDLTPPTDDRPFFFNMLSFWDAWRFLIGQGNFNPNMNLTAVKTLVGILVCVLVLSVLLIFLPLIKTTALGTSVHLELSYFALIGLGYMFIEISQLQRLMVFLGHPTYALTVVLFSLLLSSGLGSLSTRRVDPATRQGRSRLLLLCALLLIFALVTEPLVGAFRSSEAWVRIALATGMLASIGFFLGMAFPLGMRRAEADGKQQLTAWFWGVNGATSVLASVLATATSMFSGIQMSYWVGFVCYLGAMGVFWTGERRPGGAQ